jgi:outer membrane protein assembly factor BamB
MLHALLLVLAVLAPGPVRSDIPLEHVWTVGLDAWKEGGGIVSVHARSDLLLVEDATHRVTALERDTGSARWMVQLNDRLMESPGFAAGRITLATHDRLTVLDESTGARIHDALLAAETAAAPVAGESLVFEPSLLDTTLFARLQSNGRLAWRYRTRSGFQGEALYVPTAGEALLVIPCTDGVLRALPASVAQPTDVVWSADVGSPVGPVVMQGSTLLFSTDRRTVYAIDAVSGAIQWRTGLGSRLLTSPVIANDLVFVGTQDALVGMRIADGTMVWTIEGSESPVAGVPGLVICRHPSGRIFGRRTSDGSVLDLPIGQRVLSTGDYLVDWSGGRRLSAARSTERSQGSVH